MCVTPVQLVLVSTPQMIISAIRMPPPARQAIIIESGHFSARKGPKLQSTEVLCLTLLPCWSETD